MRNKKNISEYTEKDFLCLVSDIYECNGSENEIDEWVEEFIRLVKHPEGSDLIFYPPDNRDDSPEAIINEIKRWYKDNGLPLFKSE